MSIQIALICFCISHHMLGMCFTHKCGLLPTDSFGKNRCFLCKQMSVSDTFLVRHRDCVQEPSQHWDPLGLLMMVGLCTLLLALKCICAWVLWYLEDSISLESPPCLALMVFLLFKDLWALRGQQSSFNKTALPLEGGGDTDCAFNPRTGEAEAGGVLRSRPAWSTV